MSANAPLQRVLVAFPDARKVGTEYIVRCPCHEDNRASLNFHAVEDGNIVLKCRAGCDTAAVLASVGLKLSDLFKVDHSGREKPVNRARRVRGRVVAEYRYEDEDGTLRYRVERDHNKEFFPARPDGRDGWINNLQGVTRLPYRLPELTAAVAQSQTVLINEGEKDVDNCYAFGFASTTTAGGVGSKNDWRSLAQHFQNAKVCVLPDNDGPGREYAAAVAAALAPIAASVQILELPGLPPKGDVSDWIQAGGTADELRVLVDAAPRWTPTFWTEAHRPQALSTDYKPTDLGNAERFVDAHGENYRFDHDVKQWYRYDGKQWAVDATLQVQEAAKQTIRAIYGEAKAEQDEQRRTALVKHALASEKAGRVAAMVQLAQTDPRIAVRQAVWDADPMALNCENGTIDLRTAMLRPHSPLDLITKIAPVAYDPQAAAPTWERCLTRWQPDGEVRAFLQRAAGYSLTGNIGEETAFLTYGLGRNGKSKFTGALAYLMGDYAARISIEALMENRRAGAATPELVPLVGARLVVASEVQEGKRLNESFVKDVTGGDPITARAMYGAIFTFRPAFKLWMYGNHKPDIRGTDDGIWSRLPLIPFTLTIPMEERDPELSAKLEAEAPGILAWAVRGCLEWQQMRLAPPEAVVAATAEYRKEQDTAGRFFTEFCLVRPERDDIFTPTATLRAAYEQWAESEGERRPLNPNQFAERLRRLGLHDDKRRHADQRQVRGWVGIALLETEREPDDGTIDSVDSIDGVLQKSPRMQDIGDFSKTPSMLSTLSYLSDPSFTYEEEEKETENEYGDTF